MGSKCSTFKGFKGSTFRDCSDAMLCVVVQWFKVRCHRCFMLCRGAPRLYNVENLEGSKIVATQCFASVFRISKFNGIAVFLCCVILIPNHP